jgi:putative flippase GtrA
MPYLLAHFFAWGVAISVSFFLNCRFTYRVRPTWRRYVLFPLSNLPNVLATSVGVVALVEVLEFDKRVAPLIAGLCAVPFSYLLGKVLMVRAHGGSMMESAQDTATTLKDSS